MTLPEMDDFVRPQWDNILRDDLTLVAEAPNRRTAGCSMALDFATSPPPALQEVVANSKHYMAVMSLIDHLEDHYVRLQGFKKEDFPHNHTVHMFMLATQPEFRNQGIASTLRAAALQHYKRKGYSFAMSEASNAFTQRICNKFGFKTHLTIAYEDWFPEGSPYRKQVADGHASMKLMVKEL